MDRSSYFIKDKALFGSFPTQNAVDELEKEGVRYFIDLTYPDEKNITPYTTQYTYISFPIKDRYFPENKYEFAKFIIKICRIIIDLKNNEKIYGHCKGGHGRSGIFVSVILCQLFGFTSEEALEHTTKSHNNRLVMRDKWRKIGSPQTYHQKNFVHSFCKPLYFYKACKTGNTAGFSNSSPHPVRIENVGIFPTSDAAFQLYKPEDDDPIIQKTWKKEAPSILYKILKHKFDQNKELIENLTNTGLSPIIYHTRSDDFLGDGYLDGANLLGKTLTKLRNYYYFHI
jgi:predicted NAD-dependent protein-ADP-ribosyltransferase YbiA (DUF1768 family)